eukprot:scaffold8412_cov48-Attheya_sp.AAC.1
MSLSCVNADPSSLPNTEFLVPMDELMSQPAMSMLPFLLSSSSYRLSILLRNSPLSCWLIPAGRVINAAYVDVDVLAQVVGSGWPARFQASIALGDNKMATPPFVLPFVFAAFSLGVP